MGPKVMGNLCQHGFAYAVEEKMVKDKDYDGPFDLYIEQVEVKANPVNSPSQIVLSREGIATGRVLYETRHLKGQFKYRVFIFLAWIAVIVLFVQTILIPLGKWSVDLLNVFSIVNSFLQRVPT